jgi:hypothetical protein
MPSTENDRRNRQQPILERPSLPDHDRRKDEGMHKAWPATAPAYVDSDINPSDIMNIEEEIAPPDQEYKQILTSGAAGSN